MIPPWHAISEQKSIPWSRVELFVGAGDVPRLNEPDSFADLVRDFMATSWPLRRRRLQVVRFGKLLWGGD
ncbi:hypothetical protein [Mycolicibacterium hodleri]|uniref:Uncharacterized protein n=1 Tax=Mycolicibacterium hodleri TaxID=49897 RepID=A0A502E7R5_9MYCO|nr:hypothetical protein [Mycolicibacterium hodleri]TPG33785.1 hypothetical protein EAH80_16295 [Mycolicibacterium hodleri]